MLQPVYDYNGEVLPVLRIKVWQPSPLWDPTHLWRYRGCQSDAEVYTQILLVNLEEIKG